MQTKRFNPWGEGYWWGRIQYRTRTSWWEAKNLCGWSGYNIIYFTKLCPLESEEMGLTLNVKKTECMVISKKAIVPSCNLQSRGQQIKLVKKFKYLGYMITSDGKCITEIKKRIATAKDAFQKLSLILKNRNISMTTKFRVLKTYVWSTLTYGCECWTITSDIEKKIEAAEMWFIRRMLRISWAEKKTNVNVLREGNVQRSLLKTIRKRQMEFLGHV